MTEPLPQCGRRVCQALVVLVVLAVVMPCPAHAADAEPVIDNNSARIATEQAAARATLAERERECNGRFAVTACVEQARREHRSTLASLRRQQDVLDDAERRQRAAERLDRLDAKAEADRLPPVAPRVRQPRAARPAEEGASAPARPAAAQLPAQSQAAARAAAFEARSRAAQSRREAVERRNAEREQKGKKAQPLPVPASPAKP